MVRGRGGVFEVSSANEVLFSKRASGRFPRPGEVESLIEQRLAKP
jgi:predicted Rdx family selenoprotein